MEKFYVALGSIATVVGTAFAAYSIGSAGANTSQNVQVVINKLATESKNAPEEYKTELQNILSSISELIEIAVKKESPSDDQLEKTSEELVQGLTSLALAKYRSKSSPYRPELDVSTMFCDDKFIVAYKLRHGGYDNFQVNGKRYNLSSGDVVTFSSGKNELVFTHLEYDEEAKSPVIKYECLIKT